MYFESIDAFLAMGRHGPYVWSAYGLSLLLISTNLVLAVRRRQQVREQIRRQIKREETA